VNESDCKLLTFGQSLLETITASEARAQRDNDLVYHQDVPPASSILAIQATKLVSPTVPKGLVNPSSVLRNRRPLFSNLISWGALEAISKFVIFSAS
jgi:programmed cell death 6-interacting protein